jgi:hypothetical protein
MRYGDVAQLQQLQVQRLQQLQQSYSDPSDHASTHGATVPATVQLQRSYSALQQLQCSAGALTAARRRADPALLPKVVSVRE